jgi:hypothetical protein
MTAAVVYDQKILWKVGLGSAEMGPKARPVSPDNIFRIGTHGTSSTLFARVMILTWMVLDQCTGSISKVFPDLMLLQLRDRGVLDLDEEVFSLFHLEGPESFS